MRGAWIAILLLALMPQARAAEPFTYAELPRPVPDAAFWSVRRITRTGAMVGTFGDREEFQRGFIRSPDGTVTSFAVVPHRDSALAKGHPDGTVAKGMNSAGEVVGYYHLPRYRHRGFRRDASGGMSEIAHPDNPDETYPEAINASGHVLGTVFSKSQSASRVFLLSPSGEFTFADPPEAVHAFARALLDDGRILGTMISQARKYGFVRHPDGTFTIIRPPIVDPEVFALVDMNDAGQIVGFYSWVDEGPPTPFLREPDGRYILLNTPSGFDYNWPTAIGPNGEIAGIYSKGPYYEKVNWRPYIARRTARP